MDVWRVTNKKMDNSIMAYDDQFRFSVHAVFTDNENRILQLESTYENQGWGLPGGAVDPGETVHEALRRECLEELGVEIKILYMSGLYYHKKFNSQVGIFRCEMSADAKIQLSHEHAKFRYFTLNELSEIQRHRVLDCLHFEGKVQSAKF